MGPQGQRGAQWGLKGAQWGPKGGLREVPSCPVTSEVAAGRCCRQVLNHVLMLEVQDLKAQKALIGALWEAQEDLWEALVVVWEVLVDHNHRGQVVEAWSLAAVAVAETDRYSGTPDK